MVIEATATGRSGEETLRSIDHKGLAAVTASDAVTAVNAGFRVNAEFVARGLACRPTSFARSRCVDWSTVWSSGAKTLISVERGSLFRSKSTEHGA